MITIPISIPSREFSQVTNLSGSDFILLFHWNTRESAWYVSIFDQDENLLASSRKVVVDFPLIPRATDTRLPKGVLMFSDTTGFGQDPGEFDLGTRVELYFVTADDLP